MSLKKTLNYSPNFNSSKRRVTQIKFLIFHYTGMKKEKDAIRRLTDIRSKVSSHYFIKNNGEIVLMVPDLFVAWHAGKSCWKNYKFINNYSIGIELNNPGHDINYKRFSSLQIKSLLILSKKLIKKYKIKSKNILGHSDIAPDRKKDPGEKFPWEYLSKNKVGIWHTLSKKKIKKERSIKLNKEHEKIFYENLIKIGYKIKKSKYNRIKKNIIKAFQRRFRQELINGKLDKECLLISENIVKK